MKQGIRVANPVLVALAGGRDLGQMQLGGFRKPAAGHALVHEAEARHYFLRSAGFDDLAVAQDDDLVGQGDDALLVGDDHDGPTALCLVSSA